MTLTMMNISAHSSETPLYSTSSSTCDATAKYAKVTTPVVAMPTERMRAPRAYESAKLHEQHRPRERRSCLDDLAVPGQQLHERPLRPVVHVARRVAEVTQVRAAGHVERAPQRLARHRDQQVARRDARHLGDRVLGVG